MLFKELNQKLTLSLEFFVGELTKIHTGRASTALVENIELEAYGGRMKIKEVGSISVPEPQTILIAPWDRSLLKDIEKALRESSLGVNPIVGGDSVKMPIPALTEDRRKEMSKMAGVKLEDCKNSMRSIRQDAMKQVDKAFGDKEIGEDDKFNQKEEVEEIVKDYVRRAEVLSDKKKEEILQI
ncbi:ribosome recycling factor [candidate division WWE3 bacterium CG08_land_8_20_14_0_20_41_10]|uniref:Ribosome-recycling factor n=1 Tax=candidate division WWE3 bacterium CG08_land_8_20_14_0_20_41_10 TaxID=1975085 RepID=A0A2H0XB54_UNCKA|nr:MAG: ribosome recycling factor [candidate division WWE3 bacterium CG08_land_8_20_14_0_20_41_10]